MSKTQQKIAEAQAAAGNPHADELVALIQALQDARDLLQLGSNARRST